MGSADPLDGGGTRSPLDDDQEVLVSTSRPAGTATIGLPATRDDLRVLGDHDRVAAHVPATSCCVHRSG